jgi:hypothetical protein
MNDGIIIALLIGVVLGASGFYAWYLKMERIQRFIDSSGIVENYKLLKIERDELRKIVKSKSHEIEIKDIEIERYRKAIIAFGERERRTKEIEKELASIKKFQTWQYGHLFTILNRNGIKLTDEEWNELTPSD